jgi:hypothetical protein
MTRPKAFPTLAAAEVIAQRMPLMWWACFAPSAKRQAELTRMVAEKNAALVEGVVAANMRAGFEVWEFWAKATMGTLPRDAAPRALSHIADAATAPAARRVKANRKRLRRHVRI